MRMFIAALALSAAAAALPAASDDPVRVLPHWWHFNITALSGPGCPDGNIVDRDAGRNTRLTYGQNTVDGSEVYYWHVAYPHMRVALADGQLEANTWCETTLQYTEETDGFNTPPTSQYHLRLHKNGTRMIAIYDMDEDVTATWTFTYYPPLAKESVVTDTITINGPRRPSPDTTSYEDLSSGPDSSKTFDLEKCGSGTFRFRTDLRVSAKAASAKGEVSSLRSPDVDGKQQYYGVQQGFSYDWKKCET